jgi:DNA-binding transcriptional LysR family regulator
MNINDFNVNLLRALDALISEQNVTRAAKLLNITQSAMSSSLAQLRKIFNDDLLVRCQHGMLLTPRAQELSQKIKPIMQQINRLTRRTTQFNPATCNRLIQIVMTDFACSVLIEPLIKELAAKAPGMHLDIRPLDNARDPTSLLANPQNELFIGYSGSTPKNFQYQRIREIQSVVVARRDHPLMLKKMSMNDYLNADHLAIEAAGHDGFSNTDAYLQIMGEQRKICLTVPHTLIAVNTLPHTSLIVTMPKDIMSAFEVPEIIAYQDMPFTFPAGYLSQIWHQRFEYDLAHLWLRETINDVAKHHVEAIDERF